MNLIARYVVAELLKVFLATLASLTLLMILVGVAHEAIREGLGLMATLRLIPFVLPNALVFALPGTLLFSACSVYGRMSAGGEIIALKSAGISPMMVVWPALILSLLISLGAVWLVDVAFTWGHRGVKRVVLESIEESAYRVLRTRHSFSRRGFSIHVAGVQGHALIRPTISLPSSGDNPAVTITAREAEFRRTAERGELSVLLTDGTIDVGNNVTMVFPDTIERVIPLGNPAGDDDRNSSPSHIPLRRIGREMVAQQQRIRGLKQSLAAEAAFDMTTGNLAALTGDTFRRHQRTLASQWQRLYRLRTEPWRRWASGFSCFCFAIVGVPLAIRLRTADIMTTFALCFLPILIAYYPLFAFGLDRAKQGAVPPAVVWLGNLACLAVGAWLIRNVIRH